METAIDISRGPSLLTEKELLSKDGRQMMIELIDKTLNFEEVPDPTAHRCHYRWKRETESFEMAQVWKRYYLWKDSYDRITEQIVRTEISILPDGKVVNQSKHYPLMMGYLGYFVGKGETLFDDTIVSADVIFIWKGGNWEKNFIDSDIKSRMSQFLPETNLYMVCEKSSALIVEETLTTFPLIWRAFVTWMKTQLRKRLD